MVFGEMEYDFSESSSPTPFAHTHVWECVCVCVASAVDNRHSMCLADGDLYTLPSVGDLCQMVIITGYYANLTRTVKLIPWPGGHGVPFVATSDRLPSPSKKGWKSHRQLCLPD